MRKIFKKKQLPQAEQTFSEWLMEMIAHVAGFYHFFLYEGNDIPAEMTISVDVFPDLPGELEDYYFKAKDNVLSFTYSGDDFGYTHLHLLEDPFSDLGGYNRQLALEALRLNTRNPEFLIGVQGFLKTVAPEAELFLWVSNTNVLHVTSLSKNPEFKRFLKMQGLV